MLLRLTAHFGALKPLSITKSPGNRIILFFHVQINLGGQKIDLINDKTYLLIFFGHIVFRHFDTEGRNRP